MRKTVALLLACAGAVVVCTAATASPRKAVTIQVSRPIVVFGSTINLSGKVSSPQSGQKVDVMAQPFGATSPSMLATVDTMNGGRWTFDVKPTIQTMYEAQWMGQTSSLVKVEVRPAIKLMLVSTSGRVGTFSTTVTGARSFAGKFVLVQRFVRAGVTTLKKVVLDANSSATFKVRLHHERHERARELRVVMPTSQTAPGYITGFSNILSVKS